MVSLKLRIFLDLDAKLFNKILNLVVPRDVSFFGDRFCAYPVSCSFLLHDVFGVVLDIL